MCLPRCEITALNFFEVRPHQWLMLEASPPRGAGSGGEGVISLTPCSSRLDVLIPWQAKREALLDEPLKLTVDDALTAPVAVARWHARRITEVSAAD